ncbi:MAG: ribosome recycling factor [bacterium]|nr:ribosome recycling factor [bacterium]
MKFTRVLLKLSGEALMGDGEQYSHAKLSQLAQAIAQVTQMDVQVGIVVGAGNLFRARSANLEIVDRVTADNVGMLATIMNGAIIRDYLRGEGLQSQILSPREVRPLTRSFARDEAIGYPARACPDLRGRHRQSVLHHRLGGCAARPRDQRRCAAQGYAGRRHLRQGPAQVQGCRPVRPSHLRRGGRAPTRGHGPHGGHALRRAGPAHVRVRHHRPRQPGRGDRGSPAGNLDPQGDAVMSAEVKENAELAMEEAVDGVKQRLHRIRTGKASPSILDGVKVDYYGALTPLIQLASIAVPEPRMLAVKPFDRAAINAIERAIQASNLGLNPSSDGMMIRLHVPELTGDRRKELAKQARDCGEEGKIAVRRARQEANDVLKKELKDSDITEDEAHKDRDEIQKLTDKYCATIDAVTEAKQKEITEL